ncbi:(2Fe-2S) ferredoxin domain-containing protein [Thiolapillus sp.]
MSHFKYHVFVCTNEREGDTCCCARFGATRARTYLKNRCKELGIHGNGRVRINAAGCLDQCARGPVLVIYPEETWYTYVDDEDLDEIIARHLQLGQIVERLKISP